MDGLTCRIRRKWRRHEWLFMFAGNMAACRRDAANFLYRLTLRKDRSIFTKSI
jgi:hypothetical protein